MIFFFLSRTNSSEKEVFVVFQMKKFQLISSENLFFGGQIKDDDLERETQNGRVMKSFSISFQTTYFLNVSGPPQLPSARLQRLRQDQFVA